jgi:hypothetical protein
MDGNCPSFPVQYDDLAAEHALSHVLVAFEPGAIVEQGTDFSTILDFVPTPS